MRAKKRINVILTSAGAQVAPGIIRMLKDNRNYSIKVIGVDAGIRDELVGRHFCDRFYSVPYAYEKEYIPCILKICTKEKISIIFPGSDEETVTVAKNKDTFLYNNTKIICSDYSSVKLCTDKFKLMSRLKENRISVGKFYGLRDMKSLMKHSRELGYPKHDIVIKPRIARGSKGFRVITGHSDAYKKFLDNRFYLSSLDEIVNVFKRNAEQLKRFFLMEYFQGPKYSVDILLKGHVPAVHICREKIFPINSPTQVADIVYDKDIVDYAGKIARFLRFEYFVQIEVGRNRDNEPSLIEINPRIDATLPIVEGLGINYFEQMINYAMEGVFTGAFRISKKKNLRFYRYWEHIFAKVG